MEVHQILDRVNQEVCIHANPQVFTHTDKLVLLNENNRLRFEVEKIQFANYRYMMGEGIASTILACTIGLYMGVYSPILINSAYQILCGYMTDMETYAYYIDMWKLQG